MWVARRARTKATYPGKLDNMVAGGHPLGISAFDNLLKECYEEAGIPPEIARNGAAYRDNQLPDGRSVRPQTTHILYLRSGT